MLTAVREIIQGRRYGDDAGPSMKLVEEMYKGLSRGLELYRRVGGWFKK
jgi:hypothetical protein